MTSQPQKHHIVEGEGRNGPLLAM